MCITPLPPGNKETAFGRFFIACRKRAGRLRALRVRFEGLGLPAQPAPNRQPAAAARQPCAPWARFVVLIRFRLSWLLRRTTHESVSERRKLTLIPKGGRAMSDHVDNTDKIIFAEVTCSLAAV